VPRAPSSKASSSRAQFAAAGRSDGAHLASLRASGGPSWQTPSRVSYTSPRRSGCWASRFRIENGGLIVASDVSIVRLEGSPMLQLERVGLDPYGGDCVVPRGRRTCDVPLRPLGGYRLDGIGPVGSHWSCGRVASVRKASRGWTPCGCATPSWARARSSEFRFRTRRACAATERRSHLYPSRLL
jgi:hypothetical protein